LEQAPRGSKQSHNECNLTDRLPRSYAARNDKTLNLGNFRTTHRTIE